MSGTGFKPRVLLPNALDPDAENRLGQHAELLRPDATDSKSLCAAIADCDALIVRTHTPVTRELLSAGKRLCVVGVAGVGLDNVDLAAAEALGIKVLSKPDAASDAVAELTVALMLQLLRPIPGLAEQYRTGSFRQARAAAHGDELREKTVGIIGMGRIGSRVARICRAGFGAHVFYNDIVDVGPLSFDATCAEQADVFARSDIITLHVPLTDATRGMIDASALEQFKPLALLINTARGAVVDTDALRAALNADSLAGAALDVVTPEPLPVDHELFQCEHCILTPHIAARTHSGLRNMMGIADDVLAHLLRSAPRS